MPFKSSLRLNAKIFNKSERRRAFSSVVSISARGFRRSLQQKMINGPHTGIIYDRGKASGDGFTRRHRASRRGERPSPDTNTLVNSIEDRRIDDLSATVEVTKPVLDNDGEEVLQGKLGREIMTEADVAEADKDFNERAERALIDLL